MMMFAYLKSVRRLVNLVIKAGMAGPAASAAACAGDVQLMTSCVQLVTPGRSSHDTGSTFVQHLPFGCEI